MSKTFNPYKAKAVELIQHIADTASGEASLYCKLWLHAQPLSKEELDALDDWNSSQEVSAEQQT